MQDSKRRERGLGGPALMSVAAAMSLAAGTNQRSSREIRSGMPLLRTGLHSVRAHHIEPRKTCSRVRGICRSAVMKREFVQPCARQNSEFTSPPSPKKHVPMRQEQDKKRNSRRRRRERKREEGEEEGGGGDTESSKIHNRQK